MLGRTVRHCLVAAPLIMWLSGCGVYIHDKRLVTPSTKAVESLTSEATLKPFDDQLALLDAIASDEDQIMARYWTSARDADLAHLVSLEPSRRHTELQTRINERQQALGARMGQAEDLYRLSENLRFEEENAGSLRRDLAQVIPASEKFDVSCEARRKALTLAEADRLSQSPNERESLLAKLSSACYGVLAAEQEINNFIKKRPPGSVATAAREYHDALAGTTKPDLTAYAAQLEAEIKAAEEHAKKGETAGLASLQERVAQILSMASDATKLAGWESVSEKLDKSIRGHVCSAKEGISTAELAAADCSNLEPATTAGRARATWGLAFAVAQLIKANNAQSRSVQWLLAAKAIVAAEQADAKLKVEEARHSAAAHRRRLEALMTEQDAIKAASDALKGSSPTCLGRAHDCALAGYIQSWNNGRIPAEVTVYRPVQIGREYAVRRARAVADKQRSLALAGASAIKGKADNGLNADEIAQGLINAALIAR